jgi:hypothetical protein
MARPSTIDRLPSDILEQLQALLRDPRVSQLDATARINVILEEQGHPDRLSKSAVNRYSMRMEEAGRHLRESREVAEMWIANLGTAPENKVGQLTNEFVRTLSFDLSLMIRKAMAGDLDWGQMPEAVGMLKDLAITQHRLEQAQMQNVKREQEIRKQAAEAAASAAEKSLVSQGMSRDSIDTIKREILGIA